METEILPYCELKQKNSLLPLMDQAFMWPFDPVEFEKSVRRDPRLREGSIGFCAIKKGKVVGYVGVMDITLKNALGMEERVGGLYGVATHPGYARHGICTALIDHSHKYFIAKGYRFSLLTTGRTNVAHALYEKVGYFDVAPFLSAYLEAPMKRQKALRKKSFAKLDRNRMLELFHRYVKDWTGFVTRDEEYLKMLFKQYEISGKDCVLSEKGYVIFKKQRDSVRIRELVALNSREMDRLIGLVEAKTQKPLVARLGISDSAVIQLYASRGFTVLETGYGVLMAKELVADVSFADCFGGRFYMSALDSF
jgi:ribosomal protein S18 acetylase RimI-like enzyme